MAISVRANAVANSAGAAAASLTITKPTGTVQGDVMVATISINNGSTPTITPPTGWTLIVRTNNTTVLGQANYIRVAGASEGANYQWTNTSEFISGVIVSYVGVDNTAPLAGFSALGITTASTSQTYTAATQQAETVYAVLCGSSRNTTGTTTVSTASSGSMTDGDTCTTATDFIESYVLDQHATYSFIPGPLSVAPGATTLSRSCTGITCIVLLRPAVPTGVLAPVFTAAILQRANSGTAVVPSVQTFYPNEVIYAFVIGTGGGTVTVSISGGSLTWTKQYSHQDSVLTQGYLWVFTAIPSSPLAASTITASSAAGDDMTMLIYTFLGANTTAPIGATGNSETNTGAASKAITTTVNNSWVWAMYYDTTADTVPTAGTGQTNVWNGKDTNELAALNYSRQTATTSSSGTSVIMNMTAPTADATSLSVIELLPFTASPIGKDTGNLNNSLGANITQGLNRAASF